MAGRDDGCICGGTVIVREFGSGGLSHHFCIGFFGGRGATQSYDFTCPPELRGRRNLSLVEAYSAGGGDEKGSWRKL